MDNLIFLCDSCRNYDLCGVLLSMVFQNGNIPKTRRWPTKEYPEARECSGYLRRWDKIPHEELKPCPFCHEIPVVTRYPYDIAAGETYYKYEVRCMNPKCGCRINMIATDTQWSIEDVAVANAVAAWNKRL